MTNLQKIQQETEEMFDKFHSINIEIHCEKCEKKIKQFIHSRESIAYKAGKEDGYAEEGINCHKHCKEALKAGLEEVRNKIENIPDKSPETESDNYDAGLFVMKSKVLTLIDTQLK